MKSPKLDAALPLTGRDFDRFEILRKSLDRFFPDLGTCWVMVADREYDDISRRIRDNQSYRVIAESTIAPELRFYDHVRVALSRSHQPLDGWCTQQLRKLAVAQYITSPFYLTLDADVVCTRLVRYTDLIRNGRALSEKRQSDFHQDWYERAGQVLGVPFVRPWHNLAPALLSREAVILLQQHLAGRVHPFLRLLSRGLAERSASRSILASWRSYLLRNLPWTEYALYYSFLEARQLFDRYHVLDPDCVLEGNSVWTREAFASWRPDNGLSCRQCSFFAVVQSNLAIRADTVWEKVRPYLEGAPVATPSVR